MSDVWLARQCELALPVVIKTLREDFAAGPEARKARMAAEARLMARVGSARVVRALDVGIVEGVPFMVQEYVDGLDLNELDKRRRAALGVGLPLWFVCEAVAQAAQGLHAAHQSGVLHRDVKPSNLLLAPECDESRIGVKLGDFGIAVPKELGEHAAVESSGTLRFMAPEAIKGLALDRRADVYSLGATAIDLRYGQPPYTSLEALLAGAPPEIPAPGSPHEAFFQAVARRMIALDAADRFFNLTEPLRLMRGLGRTLAPRNLAHAQADGSIALGGLRVLCRSGDVALARSDGIVCSSTSELTMQSGVGAALRRAGGDDIEAAAVREAPQPLGACIPTRAGKLHAKYVLHAVSAWEEVSCIGRATQRALLLAEELGLRSLAVPAIGTGARPSRSARREPPRAHRVRARRRSEAARLP